MKIKKMIIIILGVIVVIVLVVFCYFFVGSAPRQNNITWGVDFSQMQSEALKLNWQENYL